MDEFLSEDELPALFRSAISVVYAPEPPWDPSTSTKVTPNNDMEKVFVLVELDDSILVDGDVLGKKYELMVKNTRACMHFPLGDFEFNHLAPPTAEIDWDSYRTIWGGNIQPRWGYGNSQRATVASVLIELYINPMGVSGSEQPLLYSSIRDLSRVFAVCCELHSRSSYFTPLENARRPSLHAFFTLDDRIQVDIHDKSPDRSASLGNSAPWTRAILASELIKFLDFSCQKQHSLCCDLLYQAHQGYRQQDYRKAVLEAAAAAEVAIGAAIRQKLAEAGNKYVDETVSNCNGMANLKKFAAVVGIDIPQLVINNVAGPRNKTIHEGLMPTAEVAFRSLRATDDLLESLGLLEFN